jgi:hypothetical protein
MPVVVELIVGSSVGTQPVAASRDDTEGAPKVPEARARAYSRSIDGRLHESVSMRGTIHANVSAPSRTVDSLLDATSVAPARLTGEEHTVGLLAADGRRTGLVPEIPRVFGVAVAGIWRLGNAVSRSD